ncbi:hypothetical protein [Psychromonas sp. GE-S-Ul-11]|uniref:hypothetical protein n=1 Tax=Psychromonas sp. GE-S-Ul-11 TaxID=3241170 RepID=UPI00390CB2E8
MLETAILVLLYNKEIKDSSTLNSLIKSTAQYSNAKIVIWNNGPKKLNSVNSQALIDLGYQTEIVETVTNDSLAVIYNRFIKANQAKKYILLDDDSELSEQFIKASALSKPEHLSLPIITSNGKVQYPSIDRKRYSSETIIKDSSRVTTIGSGLVLGINIVNALNEYYNSVFDERFYLYGVDTTFCLRVNESEQVKHVKLITGFDHSLSKLEMESETMTRFRRIERSYELGLKLRYYMPLSKTLFLLLKTGTSVLKRLCLGKRYKVSFLYVVKAFLSGKHYRS